MVTYHASITGTIEQMHRDSRPAWTDDGLSRLYRPDGNHQDPRVYHPDRSQSRDSDDWHRGARHDNRQEPGLCAPRQTQSPHRHGWHEHGTGDHTVVKRLCLPDHRRPNVRRRDARHMQVYETYDPEGAHPEAEPQGRDQAHTPPHEGGLLGTRAVPARRTHDGLKRNSDYRDQRDPAPHATGPNMSYHDATPDDRGASQKRRTGHQRKRKRVAESRHSEPDPSTARPAMPSDTDLEDAPLEVKAA
jgi:hypothetical protein